MYTIQNQNLAITLLDPVADQERFGTRYCTGGYIFQVDDGKVGPLLSGPTYPDSFNVFDGQGIPDAFSHNPLRDKPTDTEGQIMFHGRTKEMLKVGGENVAAAEIETYLAQHPAVKLAQAVGVPDKRLQEVPAIFVEKHEGHEISEQELIDFCKGQIASYKVPRYVRFVTEWPMSTSKIQKFRLREQILAELEIDED